MHADARYSSDQPDPASIGEACMQQPDPSTITVVHHDADVIRRCQLEIARSASHTLQ